MLTRLRERPVWQFFAVFPKASRGLTTAWWALLICAGVLPAVFAVATGLTVGAVDQGAPLVGPLVLTGVVFVGLQVVGPLLTAVSLNLGSLISAYLNERLITACVTPPGIGHLEDPDLAEDLTVAREFDRGQTGPPMSLNVDFTASGLIGLLVGASSAVVLAAFAWWAALLLALAWGSTHWLLRESGVWRDRNTPEVRAAQRHADYAYSLAVDPGPAKEVRLFGLPGWVVEQFARRRRELFDLQYRATRLRERSVIGCLAIVLVANLAVFGALGWSAAIGTLGLDQVVVYVQVALGVSQLAFGGLNWVLDGAAAPVVAVNRLEPAMAPLGALPVAADPVPGPPLELRLRDVHFGYPGGGRPIFSGLDLTVPAGASLAIVGQNGAGKTTLAKLLCRLYDPDRGVIQIGGQISGQIGAQIGGAAEGVDLRTVDLAAWRTGLTAVFQDFVRFELSLRENVDPAGRAGDADIRAALTDAGADGLADLDTVLAKGYPGGTDLSGGQWQRVALARALCAVRRGARLVLLDEPTAQLDVRGEAEVFERVLRALETESAGVTTILVSHRFSTVRMADRICVLEHGRVIEFGTHAELMERGGRYRTMFDLQARRFAATMDEEGEVFDVLA